MITSENLIRLWPLTGRLVRKITNVLADSLGVKKAMKEKKYLFYNSHILILWLDKGVVSKAFVVYQGGQYCEVEVEMRTVVPATGRRT